jgi:hypothetical protein
MAIDDAVEFPEQRSVFFFGKEHIAEPMDRRLSPGGRWIRTCMGLFLSSGRFWFVTSSLFGAGKPFFIPSPVIRFAERAEGVKGPKH